MNNQLIKRILLESLQNLPAEDMQVPLPIKALLGGKNPVAFIAGQISDLPDSVIPHIVEMARKITEVADHD